MQPAAWYIRRLLLMSPAEIAWRMKSLLQDQLDKYRFPLGLYPQENEIVKTANLENIFGFGFPITREDPGSPQPYNDVWLKQLIARAESIAAHRLTFFDLEDCFLGDPIQWNRDHANNKDAPLGYSQSIDYRDFKVTGDCKLVWEPNRHHHLVVLGRAYRVTGNQKYAEEIIGQLESWMEQCPFGKGMNWRSPLELGIRLINWVWAVELIRDSGFCKGDFFSKLLHRVYLHLWEITRKFSRGSSANNHLIGEAAGVFVAANYFNFMKNSTEWSRQSRDILISEIAQQTYPDGCTREQAMGYHLFVLQFFLIAGIVGRWTGNEFPAAYWQRIERMLEFAGALSEASNRLPLFGDADDGYVLDLGEGSMNVKDLLCVGAALFRRSNFKEWAGGFREPAWWLLGPASFELFDAIPGRKDQRALVSREFKDSGYYLLQCGQTGSMDCISAVIDCGELGFQSISAHGHADALSFVLRVFGQEVFVDPGTYDYFTYPEWRNYFRCTRAHNTVAVNGVDQSIMLGPFMWGRRARSRCVSWEPYASGGGRLAVEHDGYSRLTDPATHRRNFELDPESRTLTIVDEIHARGYHTVTVFFHLAESCTVTQIAPNLFGILLPEGQLRLQIDQRLTPTILHGSETPMGGWVSRGYHQKVSATTIAAEGECRGSNFFRSQIVVGAAGDPAMSDNF